MIYYKQDKMSSDSEEDGDGSSGRSSPELPDGGRGAAGLLPPTSREKLKRPTSLVEPGKMFIQYKS